MATRKIKVLSTVGVSGTIETNVTTLGELKPLLRQREINFQGMKLMVGETRNELNMDEATLPEGDFKLYLMPAKTKSGGAVTLNRIADTFSDLADLFQQLADEAESGSPVAKAVIDDPDVADLQRLASGTSSFEEDEDDNDWL